jgi:subtilisin family serine protease
LDLSAYLRGYRDGVNGLLAAVKKAEPPEPSAPRVPEVTQHLDDAQGTWGLHATGVLQSPYTGAGVRVAALVDGLDVTHPDWVRREVTVKSFVPGEPPHIGGISGTHYLGTAFGAMTPASGPRYACAPGASVFVAKVLDQSGVGTAACVLAGLQWAMQSGCRVILAPLGQDQRFDAFEILAGRALLSNSLVIAGAGNNARRPTSLGSVAYPAACRSVLGVASLDSSLNLASFSPRSSPPQPPEIDLAAPGVQLRSSTPLAGHYVAWSGSSTAAAYVAGIAALWAEANPQANARELWDAMTSHARQLLDSPLDVGAGLVQAPIT